MLRASPSSAAALVGRVLGLGGEGPRIDAHAFQAFPLHGFEDLGERLDAGRSPVVALGSVVEEHDGPGLETAYDAFGDLGGAGAGGPVKGADGPAHHDKAKLVGGLGDAGAHVADGRPEEDNGLARDGLDGLAASLEVVAHIAQGSEREKAVVGIAMEADGVPAGLDGSNDLGVGLGFSPDDEERGFGIFCRVEEAQDFGGVLGARAVVKGEGDGDGARGPAHDDIGEHAEAEEEDAARDEGEIGREGDAGEEERGRPEPDGSRDEGDGADGRDIEDHPSRRHGGEATSGGRACPVRAGECWELAWITARSSR